MQQRKQIAIVAIGGIIPFLLLACLGFALAGGDGMKLGLMILWATFSGALAAFIVYQSNAGGTVAPTVIASLVFFLVVLPVATLLWSSEAQAQAEAKSIGDIMDEIYDDSVIRGAIPNGWEPMPLEAKPLGDPNARVLLVMPDQFVYSGLNLAGLEGRKLLVDPQDGRYSMFLVKHENLTWTNDNLLQNPTGAPMVFKINPGDGGVYVGVKKAPFADLPTPPISFSIAIQGQPNEHEHIVNHHGKRSGILRTRAWNTPGAYVEWGPLPQGYQCSVNVHFRYPDGSPIPADELQANAGAVLLNGSRITSAASTSSHVPGSAIGSQGGTLAFQIPNLAWLPDVDAGWQRGRILTEVIIRVEL